MVESTEKVTRIEDILAASAASKENKNVETKNQNVQKVDNKKREKEKTTATIPRGKPKSGRVWKNQKQKFSSIVKSRGIRSSFEKKQQLREDLKKVKEMSKEIKAQKEAEKEAKKERRRENLKREEANKKKNEVVQVIKNPMKIKRMKKKQLRMIEKRDTVKT